MNASNLRSIILEVGTYLYGTAVKDAREAIARGMNSDVAETKACAVMEGFCTIAFHATGLPVCEWEKSISDHFDMRLAAVRARNEKKEKTQ